MDVVTFALCRRLGGNGGASSEEMSAIRGQINQLQTKTNT